MCPNCRSHASLVARVKRLSGVKTFDSIGTGMYSDLVDTWSIMVHAIAKVKCLIKRKPQCRSAQVWHTLSRDLKVLPGHPRCYVSQLLSVCYNKVGKLILFHVTYVKSATRYAPKGMKHMHGHAADTYTGKNEDGTCDYSCRFSLFKLNKYTS